MVAQGGIALYVSLVNFINKSEQLPNKSDRRAAREAKAACLNTPLVAFVSTAISFESGKGINPVLNANTCFNATVPQQ